MGETMRCFADKMRFFDAVCAHLAVGAKSLQGSVPHDPTSPCKISFQSVPICRSYSRKSDLVRSQCMPLAYERARSKFFNILRLQAQNIFSATFKCIPIKTKQ